MSRYVIVANGEFLEKEIIVECINQSDIVALDGAVTPLAKLGIRPTYILGDFDSIEEENHHRIWGITKTKSELNDGEADYAGKYGVKIVPRVNQDYTDMQKAISFCDKMNASEIHVLCAFGGRLDHQESNIRTLKMMYKSERPIYLHNEAQSMEFVKDKDIVMKGQVGDYCGILATETCLFKSSNMGLAWSSDNDGKAFSLTYGEFDSTSNELTKELAEISISGNALVVHPPMFKSQRDFSSLAIIEKLKKRVVQMSYSLVESTPEEIKQFKSFIKKKKEVKLKTKEKGMFYVTSDKSLVMQGKCKDVVVSMSGARYKDYLFFKDKKSKETSANVFSKIEMTCI